LGQKHKRALPTQQQASKGRQGLSSRPPKAAPLNAN
jgi:hypothetical protein